MTDKFDREEDSNLTAQSERLARPVVVDMEGILGHPFRVLDDGFVRLIDYMGDDAAVVQAARVSYGAGTKRVQNNRALVRYLMRHQHTTPFEMCEIKLHVRVPMDTWRQWIRHRTANVNEYSTRYSIAIDAAHATRSDEWRQQSRDNRQGSEDGLPVDVGRRLSDAESKLQREARRIYEERIGVGVAREQARKDLPLSTYTEAYWKIDLHNLLSFLYLRMDDHAQKEIRDYATIIGEQIVVKWVPMVWEAFLDYKKNSVHLSAVETKIVAALTSGDRQRAESLAGQYGLLNKDSSGHLKSNRERNELESKLASLGLLPFWEKAV